MDPIIFSSWEEQQCVTNFTSSILFNSWMKGTVFFTNLRYLENWTGNLNYWTGGKKGCRGSWNWCAGSESQPFAANLSWAPNQPEFAKENENCLHMRVFKNKSGILLSDRECKDKYIFGCKVLFCRLFFYGGNKLFHASGKTNSLACVCEPRSLQKGCKFIFV